MLSSDAMEQETMTPKRLCACGCGRVAGPRNRMARECRARAKWDREVAAPLRKNLAAVRDIAQRHAWTVDAVCRALAYCDIATDNPARGVDMLGAQVVDLRNKLTAEQARHKTARGLLEAAECERDACKMIMSEAAVLMGSTWGNPGGYQPFLDTVQAVVGERGKAFAAERIAAEELSVVIEARENDRRAFDHDMAAAVGRYDDLQAAYDELVDANDEAVAAADLELADLRAAKDEAIEVLHERLAVTKATVERLRGRLAASTVAALVLGAALVGGAMAVAGGGL